MRRTVGLLAIMCLSLGLIARTTAEPREDEATALRGEIVLSALTCKKRVENCGNEDFCKGVLEAVNDFQLGLSDPATQKDAVGKWRRFVVSNLSNARCMRRLLRKDMYCRAVNLVKAFDPHLNCPATGGTNGTCWVNRDDGEWKAEPIDIPADEQDWTQGCKLAD